MTRIPHDFDVRLPQSDLIRKTDAVEIGTQVMPGSSNIAALRVSKL
ncbi:hypothetical protein [Mesorhizobium sp. Root157]|nr:hypothetical protein [Mesorhizobium sp. Root157]